MEKKTLEDNSSPQFPETQTSFSVPMKKVKIKVPTMMPRPVPKKVVPKTHLGKAHTEIHGCEWKVEKPQVQGGGKSVPLNRIVIFLQLIPNQRGCKFST